MNRTTSVWLLTSLLVVAPALASDVVDSVDAPAAAPSVDRLIPADAELAMVVRNPVEFLAQWRSGPLGSIWSDPEMVRFLGPLRRTLEVETWDSRLREETGYELDELLGLVTGGVAIYVPSMEEMIRALEEEEDPETGEGETLVPFVVLAGAGDRADDLEALLLAQEEEERADRDEESPWIDAEREYRGVTMRIERRIDLEEPRDEASWAKAGGVVALASSAELLQEVLDDVLDGVGGGALLDAPRTGAAADRLVAGDAFWYLDLGWMLPAILASMPDPAAEPGTPPPPVDPAAMMSALGLGSLEAAFCSVDLDAGGVVMDLGLQASDDAGLLGMIALGPGAAPQPDIVPVSATSFGATSFDFAAAWAAVKEMFNAVNPALLAMAAGQIDAVGQQAGIELDPQRDLLENLRTEVVTVQVPVDGGEGSGLEQDSVVAFGIRDPAGIERLVGGIVAIAAKGQEVFEDREFLGTTIHTLAKESPDFGSMAYAVTDGRLMVSFSSAGHQSLEAVLIAAARPGESAWDRPEVRRALAALPSGAQSIQFQDAGSMVKMIVEACAGLAEIELAQDEELTVCDPAARPDVDRLTRHVGPVVSSSTKSGPSLDLKIMMLPSAGSTR